MKKCKVGAMLQTSLAIIVIAWTGEIARGGQVIWDFGPSMGEHTRCWTNTTDLYNYAEDVEFDEFMELTGIDIWTCVSKPAGEMEIKILFDNGYDEPGGDYLRWNMRHTSYEFDGNYNGTDLYKVSFDFDPVLLRANTTYWIGVSGVGWDIGQALIASPGNSWFAGFIRRDFERIYFRWDDLMFRLRGHVVFPPFEISLDGACPGEMTANLIGGTPGGTVAILAGQSGGQTTINSGPCKGATIPLGGAQLIGTVTPDNDGNASLTFNVPDNQCGQVSVAALDLSTCEVTQPARTYDVPELYLGAQITMSEGFTDFDAGGFQGFNSYDVEGMNFRHVHTPAVFSSLVYNCGNGTRAIYSPGARDMVGIKRIDGEPFEAIEFLAGDGWSNNCPFTYLWIRALLDGVVVADYTIDLPRSQVIGFTGGQFDELRIGGYSGANGRNFYYQNENERGLQALTLDNVRIGSVTIGPLLALTGTCPGNMTAQLINATPRSTVALIFARRHGQTTIPSGPCAGTVLPVAGQVQLIATTRADNQGRATITGNVPQNACGGRLLVVDAPTCAVSKVVRIE